MSDSTMTHHQGEALARSRPETLGQMLLDAAARFDGPALQYPRDGRTATISYRSLGVISTEIAQGLIRLGIEPGDRVAILGLTSANWTLADFGSLCAGAVVTPIYHTNSPEECAYVLDHSQARLIFCDDAAQAAKVDQVRGRCPFLEHVVTFEPVDGAITLDELRRRGREVPREQVYERLRAISPDDVATLVYTSGTTGPPKGCTLSHENFMATLRMYDQQLGLNHAHSMYQFLPLAHVLARIAQAVTLSVGARLIYWSGDPAKIVDELGETSPTHLPAVPRVYEKIHGAVAGEIARKPAAQRALFDWAVRCGTRARAEIGRASCRERV
jgi:long-chain acyl-CoA synthetase